MTRILVGAEIIFLPECDDDLKQYNLMLVKKIESEGGKVIYVVIKEMRPKVTSRIDMRDIITHHYFDIGVETVFAARKDRIPEMQNVIQKILDDLEGWKKIEASPFPSLLSKACG